MDIHMTVWTYECAAQLTAAENWMKTWPMPSPSAYSRCLHGAAWMLHQPGYLSPRLQKCIWLCGRKEHSLLWILLLWLEVTPTTAVAVFVHTCNETLLRGAWNINLMLIFLVCPYFNLTRLIFPVAIIPFCVSVILIKCLMCFARNCHVSIV